MAAHRRRPQTTKLANVQEVTVATKMMEATAAKDLIEDHLPPLGLVYTVLICSGTMFVLCMRDFLATGRSIGGSWDEAMMAFTKSMDWFDDSKGWKSQQGGLSAIRQATTDANNMGGFFVRKMAGAAGLAVHLQKILPLLVHPKGAQWTMGHFRPLLSTAVITNLGIATLYAVYLGELQASGATEMSYCILAILVIEAIVMAFYLTTAKPLKQGPSISMTEGKTPSSVPSRIVTRTIMIVSASMAVISGRDLLFPGFIFEFIPRDDIYLEWTNAFLHSPPKGSPESLHRSMEAPLYVGDKFISQLMGLHVLVACIYKAVSAAGIRYGSDGGGLIKAKIIWRGQFFGDGIILFTFRLFASAASTASLDFRWHVMAIAYETFILGLYGFF
jgi:hypothetical protein